MGGGYCKFKKDVIERALAQKLVTTLDIYIRINEATQEVKQRC